MHINTSPNVAKPLGKNQRTPHATPNTGFLSSASSAKSTAAVLEKAYFVPHTKLERRKCDFSFLGLRVNKPLRKLRRQPGKDPTQQQNNPKPTLSTPNGQSEKNSDLTPEPQPPRLLNPNG